MLSPDSRSVAIDFLRAPAGYTLDTAVITTYSLDLEALLALPLAMLAHSEGTIERLLAEPLLMTEALRQAGRRIHVFVDEGAIAVPHRERTLYGLLEPSVHPVRAPRGGAFHPKVWVARFESEAHKAPLIRVAVLSRNLTYDRSWDVAMVSEARPAPKKTDPMGRSLAAFLRALPRLPREGHALTDRTPVESLARDVARTRFPAPEGFEGFLAFHVLGLPDLAEARPAFPPEQAREILAISPFLGGPALDELARAGSGHKILISRQTALDDVPPAALARWDEVFVLTDLAEGEPEDDAPMRPSGLHAKILAVEGRRSVDWYVGSANITPAAFHGKNVEVVCSATGPRRGRNARGIEAFRESGFLDLCEPYQRSPSKEKDEEIAAATRRMEEARSVLAGAALRLVCRPTTDDGTWRLRLEGDLPDLGDVRARVHPLSLPKEQAVDLTDAPEWTLPLSRLVAFLGVRLSIDVHGVDDLTFTLKLPAEGLPEGRISSVLLGLIDTKEHFLRFLRALLGGLEEAWGQDLEAGHGEGAGQTWSPFLDADTLLEDLVRTASRDPERLEPVGRLIRDLMAGEGGRDIVPKDLLRLWDAVRKAIEEAKS